MIASHVFTTKEIVTEIKNFKKIKKWEKINIKTGIPILNTNVDIPL
jgi:hypothetical protein